MKKTIFYLMILCCPFSSFAIVAPITGIASVCTGAVTTLSDATPGGIWSSSSTAIATVGSLTGIVSGIAAGTVTISYIAGTGTATVMVTVNPSPAAPVISGVGSYRQGQPFIPFTVTGITDTLLWYPSATGGIGTTTAPVVSTIIPGYTTVWAGQTNGSCKSPRDSFAVSVITTPFAPVVTGPMYYCQFIGPIVPLTVTPSDSVLWYFTATGGIGVFAEPVPNINVAGIWNYWISRIDSGCESPRTLVSMTIHPRPAPPVITPQFYCQFAAAIPLIASPSGTIGGIPDTLKWYGPGVTAGSLAAPTPNTLIAPAMDSFYVTETTVFGCVSDSDLDVVPIIICTTGINETSINNLSNIELYPNPNNGIFTIKGSLNSISNENVTIKVTDILGHVVYKTEIVAQKGIINTQIMLQDNLPYGFYLLHIISETETNISQFVIER